MNIKLKEAKDYFNANIVPCSNLISRKVNWENFSSAILLSRYKGAENSDLDIHVSKRVTNDSIEASPESDQILLQWMNENGFNLLTRDFALDKPVNKSIGEEDFAILEDELFYKIYNEDKRAKLLLSLSKSWCFLGFLVEDFSTRLSQQSISGMVMGVHKLDSYLVVM